MRYLLAILVLTLLWGGAGAQLSAQSDNGLTVDASQNLGPISPYVYGASFGPLSVIPVDLIPDAQNSGVTMLRFPGGRWGDQNNIRHDQLDMFIRNCKIVGAEPSVHVRLENGTPEAAAALVYYANIEKDYNIKYWAIGNEPSLFDDYTTDDLNVQWRAIALAMLEVDPDIILIGPEPHQWTGNPAIDPNDPQGRDWVHEFLLVNGDLVDIVAIHRYPFPLSTANPVTPIDELRENAAEWSTILPNLRAVIKETTGRDDIPVAVTEVNSHWSSSIGGEATTDSLFNAIWWADVLGRLIQDQALIVNFFEFQTQDRGGWGILAQFDVRPTYHTFQLYKRFGTELLLSESSVPYLSIFAAQREDGALTLMVVNLADEEQSAPLNLLNAEAGMAEVWRLDADHMAEQLDDEDLSDLEITVPGQSATLYILPAE